MTNLTSNDHPARTTAQQLLDTRDDLIAHMRLVTNHPVDHRTKLGM